MSGYEPCGNMSLFIDLNIYFSLINIEFLPKR